jgi:hypothetical protein
MQHVKNLMLSRPYLSRVPDQSIVVSEIGEGDAHVRATRDSQGSYAFIYSPLGQPVTVSLEKLSGTEVKAWWYDPRHGTANQIDVFPKKGTREFKPPIQGKGNDWVLVLDDVSKNFPPPGAR